MVIREVVAVAVAAAVQHRAKNTMQDGEIRQQNRNQLCIQEIKRKCYKKYMICPIY